MPTIVAFLQNQWFRDPIKARQVYARNPEIREELNARFLFAGCLTGRRLEKAFGPDMCRQIIWEEISRNIGGQADASFPADLKHINAVIEKHQPGIVLVFGAPARAALQQWTQAAMSDPIPRPIPQLIYGPHPAARHASVRQELWEMSEELVFKQKDVFGVDIYGRYDYSQRRTYEQLGSVSV